MVKLAPHHGSSIFPTVHAVRLIKVTQHSIFLHIMWTGPATARGDKL